MIDSHEIERVKNSVNIVDIISRYVPLKNNGKNHFACCPFHNEKTASFSVEEGNQFYHCFGCGAQGDVVKFIMDYEGISFIDAVKSIDSTIDFMPAKDIAKNIKRASYKSNFRLPPCHKQNNIKSSNAIGKCINVGFDGVKKYMYGDSVLYPIVDHDNEVINGVAFKKGVEKYFIAGGLSYNGFTPIIKNESNNYVACVSLSNGRLIAETYNVNVAVCWDDKVMKYLCMWNSGPLKLRPAISDSDDDYLCYEIEWVRISQGDAEKPIKIKNMGVLV